MKIGMVFIPKTPEPHVPEIESLPRRAVKKPLSDEFATRSQFQDYMIPSSLHLAKMRLHFASVSLIASSGVASPLAGFANITGMTHEPQISAMAALV